jgi:hypothetical protein
LLAWAEVYVSDGDLCLLSLRRDGELIAVAPLYRTQLLERAYRRAPLMQVLRPLGIGNSIPITEVPEILTLDPSGRKALPHVVRGLLEHGGAWDWLELTLTPHQGWFDPEWIAPVGQRPPAAAFHTRTRACVVAPLPPEWPAFRASLGRNVRESIRRGENRLHRRDHSWRFVDRFEDQDAVDTALSHLTKLHRARAGLERGPYHPDYLQREAAREFLGRATKRLLETSSATPALLEVDGDVVAARLLLHAGGETFFSLSGFAPDWWEFGVATTIVAEALRARIERGDTCANFSTGPERSKLRWSRELRLHHDFVLVRKRPRSSLAFGAFWTMRAATHLYRHRQLHSPFD